MAKCTDCGDHVNEGDGHRFYEHDEHDRKFLAAQYCARCCPRCFKKERSRVNRK